MQANEEEYAVVGKLGATYGIKGWIKVNSFTEQTFDILDFSPWYLESPTGWAKIELEDSRPHGKTIVAKLAGFDTPEQARLLTGKEIAIKRDQLPALKQGEYYWQDLEGLSVIDQNGKLLGTVNYLMATGANDVLIIKGEKEHAIPYLPGTVITRVDLEKKEIHVNWELI
jgi:16S rRNA processing protein RimM